MVTFQSQASADVMMFGDVAEAMMRVIGKEPAAKGIVTVAQLPAAIAALKAAIAADHAARARPPGAAHPEGDTEPEGRQGPLVSVAQRAQPLVELFEWSLKADKPVLWGS